ncbi:Multi antimicrobial extrusion protein [Macleaya cordata]|uniref:Protein DETOXIFICATION n=1 Tax=Macleaya cordata TaxID=56857 RepID=A0A200QUW9_MACCD|nr:Multi antimicrobial extrusion protein [Macleaya cordata]
MVGLNTIAVVYMIPVGLSGAISTRVSNELGAGHPQAARLAVHVMLFMVISEGILLGLIMILVRRFWGYAYSNEEEVVSYVATMMPLLALSNFIDGIQSVLSGTARGCGWQKIGAFVNLGAYYLVGIPCAIFLAFVLHMGGKFFLQMISIMFVGHLGELSLASASMATSFASVTGLSLLRGLASALDTLCGQSYGAKRYHMLRIHMQRAMFVILIFSAPLAFIWAYTGPILLAVGQDPEISAEAGIYARFMIPSIFAYGLLQCYVRFLQTQNIVVPMMISSGITTLLHILVCWVLVFKTGLGNRGAAVANSISYWINLLLLVLYVKFSNACKKTWTGFSKEALHDIPNFIRLAIPSAVMHCLELWSFQMMVLLSGFLPNPKLETSVLSISFYYIITLIILHKALTIFFQLHSTRVSNELGAGHPQAARLAVHVMLFMVISEGILLGLIMILVRRFWGYAYSNEEEVVSYVATMMPLLALSNFIDGIQSVLSGTARGCGWQKIGAFVNLGAYYLVGIPCAIFLAFVLHMGGKYFLQMISIMCVGHLGELSLSSASMATSFASVTGFGLLRGMASALDTLCGQSYGAKQYHMLGIHMQRAMFVILLFSVPLSFVWAFTGPILLAVGQDPEISAEAGIYARFMIQSIFAYGLLQCYVRFLQTQSIVNPMMMSSGITTLLHILVCWVLVFKTGLGNRGAAVANSISYWINLLLLVLYVKFSNSCKKTWTGFSKEALHDILNFIRLAIPSAVMHCLELWSFEMMVLLSGFLPNPKLETSVLSISLNTVLVVYMIPFGLSGAISTRVSNELGAGHPQAARLAVQVMLFMVISEGLLVGLITILVRRFWGYAYSNEEEVVSYVATMMPLLALSNFIDGIQSVLSGTARGCGWQKIGAFVNLGAYYLVGIPCAILLAFVLHMGGKGLWLGIICALLVQALSLLIITLRTDWQQEAKRAMDRVNDSTIPIDTAS